MIDVTVGVHQMFFIYTFHVTVCARCPYFKNQGTIPFTPMFPRNLEVENRFETWAPRPLHHRLSTPPPNLPMYGRLRVCLRVARQRPLRKVT